MGNNRKPNGAGHKWTFAARFRRHAFGWRSQPAIARVKEAVSEITTVARRDKILAADGAVLLLERLSPALEHVDSSSGAIGSAVNRAIEMLVEIIASAPADARTRDHWLDRLWGAYQADQIPYLERLGDYWGDLCASKDLASDWADRLLELCRMAWSDDLRLRGFFQGATNCLSALLVAGRYQDILDLLEMRPHTIWNYRQYGVKALAAMGRPSEAIRCAEAERSLNDSPIAIARECEAILLAAGRPEEAYRQYGLIANQAPSYVAWFRAVAKKYLHMKPSDILDDLVAQTPGDEGKWFAAAKGAKLFNKAIALANCTPSSPQTLTRAARDFGQTNPTFAHARPRAGAGALVKDSALITEVLAALDIDGLRTVVQEMLSWLDAAARAVSSMRSSTAPPVAPRAGRRQVRRPRLSRRFRLLRRRRFELAHGSGRGR